MISPEELAPHYSAFRVSERLLLTGHSHQAWPNVGREGVAEAWDDAALHVDGKWERAFAKAERVRDGFRALLGEPAAELALDQNTHGLVLRFLSALDLRRRPRLVSSDGEFHTLRRQLARLGETALDVSVVPARPAETLAERLAGELDDRTAAVLVSTVLFEDARIVPGLEELAAACERAGAELLVDAYHALGCVPFGLPSPATWVVGGGYKYLQLGEGNCFLRLPPHADELRPAITGWYAEFEELAAEKTPGAVEYPRGGARFAGSTYDPTSHYRAARVFDFFDAQGLTPERLRESYLHQTTLLVELLGRLGLGDGADREAFGGFVAVEIDQAESVSHRLAEVGVLTDSRARHLRLGPAPYVSDDQLEQWGTAVVICEHRLERCLGAADRAVAMSGGRVAFDGSPRDMLEWALANDPALATPGARLFDLAGLRPLPAGVREARRVLPAGLDVTLPPTSPERDHGPLALAADDVWVELDPGDGPQDVLRGIELAVDGGERVALMGRNGAGKSTLLRAAAGTLSPVRGAIDAPRGAALLSQSPDDFLVHERVRHELPGEDGMRALDAAGLRWAADHDPRDLSGGERQRLALAIVTAGRGGGGEPGLVCLDEPTRGMDPARKQELAELIDELAAGGTAVLVATHDVELAAAFADRVVLLGDGVVIADGYASDVLSGGWYFATEVARMLGIAGAITPEAGAELLRATARQRVEER